MTSLSQSGAQLRYDSDASFHAYYIRRLGLAFTDSDPTYQQFNNIIMVFFPQI